MITSSSMTIDSAALIEQNGRMPTRSPSRITGEGSFHAGVSTDSHTLWRISAFAPMAILWAPKTHIGRCTIERSPNSAN